MYSHSRRKSSNYGIEHCSSHRQNIIAHDKYQTNFQNQQNMNKPYTPRKINRVPLAEKYSTNTNEHQQNLWGKKTDRSNIYEEFSKSPLKQSLSIYDMNIRQRNIRGKIVDSTRQSRTSFPQSQKQMIYQVNSARGARRSSFAQIDTHRVKQGDAHPTYPREQRNFCYLQEKDRQLKNNINKNNFSIGGKYQNKQSKTQTKQYVQKSDNNLATRSPMKTPRKSQGNINPLVQKSEMLKQRIHKIKHMTPRGSIYRNSEYEYERYGTYKQQFEDKSSDFSQAKISKQMRANNQAQSEYTQTLYQGSEYFISKQLSYRDPSENTISQDLSSKGIQNLSRKISDRLKAILDKHGG